MATAIEGVKATRADLDPLDPVAAPFGTFAPSPMLAAFRALAVSRTPPRLVQGWLYTLFSHVTKQRGLVVDLPFMGTKRRLFVDEFAHDKWIFRKGRHAEPDELATVQEHAGQGIVFVDVGANNGFFSVLCDRIAGPGTRIVAVEPHPRTFRKLQLHLALNDASRVAAENVALGAAPGELALKINRTDDGSNTLDDSGAAEADSVMVPVKTLHGLLQGHGLDRVDLLKIDVEGFEDRVLAPFFAEAPRALWPRRVMMEIAHRAARWRTDCLAEMTGRGYRIEKQTKDNAWLTLMDAPAGSD